MIGIVVEGPTDRAAAESVLAARGLDVDPRRIVITGGKRRFDSRIANYNRAAAHAPWLALRDLDRDASGCPVDLRRRLITSDSQSRGLCLRVAVRSIDAWLLADRESFARHFSIPLGKLPHAPEDLPHPKDVLTKCCKSSRSRAVRDALVPPVQGAIGPGPEYASAITDFCRTAWRPDVAAVEAPSLRRALNEIDRLVSDGTW